MLKVDTTSVSNGTANGFSAGPHTVSEVPVAGYTASSIGGDCAPDGSITLVNGDNKVCTITNNDNPGTIKVIKKIINNDGGSLTIAGVTLKVDGNTVTNGTSNPFNAGSHTVSETPISGYTSSFDGDCDVNGTVTLASGQNAVCTITNNDIAPTLTVIKNIINDNGGSLIIQNVTLKVDGNTVTNGTSNTETAGSHTVSEVPVAGYASSIGGDCAANGSVTLASGDNKVCTITNNDNPATIKVIKKIINDNGGTLTISGVTLKVDGNTVTNNTSNPFNAGQHTVSETPISGYTATFSGDCAADGIVTLAIGQNAVCTITNSDNVPTITVIKKIINNDGGSLTIAGVTLKVDGNTVTNNTSNPFNAGQHTVSETAISGYSATFSGDCNSSGVVSLAPGQHAVCTITNDDVAHIGDVGTIGFWRNWSNQYTNTNFNTLEGYVSAHNPTVFTGLTTSITDNIFHYTPKTTTDQKLLAQLLALKLNLAITALQGTGTPAMVQQHTNVCLAGTVDVSGISGASAFFGSSTPTVGSVISGVEGTWTGDNPINHVYTFSGSDAQKSMLHSVVDGINTGAILTSTGCS